MSSQTCRRGQKTRVVGTFCAAGVLLVLPLGLVALAVLCYPNRREERLDAAGTPIAGWGGTSGQWTVWAQLTAVAFSLVDWRQTKHLMLLLWNLAMLKTLATDFASFHVTPAW